MSAQLFRFLLTGGAAAAVNLTSRYLLNSVMSFEAAVVVAYLIGMTTAYVLARLYVFESSGRRLASEFYRFAIVNVFALMLVWVISVGLARLVFPAVGFTWHAKEVAHLIGVLAPAITSFLGHKHFSFAKAR
ncbi:MAG: GtrA family protein [Pseudomonadota bacterium]